MLKLFYVLFRRICSVFHICKTWPSVYQGKARCHQGLAMKCRQSLRYNIRRFWTWKFNSRAYSMAGYLPSSSTFLVSGADSRGGKVTVFKPPSLSVVCILHKYSHDFFRLCRNLSFVHVDMTSERNQVFLITCGSALYTINVCNL